MYCPNCESEHWTYSGALPEVYELGDTGYTVLLDFKCHCTRCGCTFYRREEFEYAGSYDAGIIKENE